MPRKKNEMQTTTIERMLLDGVIRELYQKGMSPHRIWIELKGRNIDISEYTVKYWIRTRLRDKIIENRKENDARSSTIKEILPDERLKEAIDEAWDNYKKASADGKAGEASGWFKHYNELLEKALKGAGTYEKAKQDAQKEEDKKIELFWVIRTVCDRCNSTIDEYVEVHNIVNTSDMQMEDIKQKVTRELLNNVTIDNQAPNIHPEPKAD